MSRIDSSPETENILDLPPVAETDTDISDQQLEAQCQATQNEPPFPPGLIVIGLLLVALFLGVATAWAIFAPLEDAVVASGLVSAAGHRKQVQHYEGGIVEKILVRDGDQVKQGRILIKLRDILPRAGLRQLERRHLEVEAIIARLKSELNENGRLEFPAELRARGDEEADVADVMAGQAKEFQTRTNLFTEKQLILEKKISQIEEEINGFRKRITTTRRQRSSLEERLSRTRKGLQHGAASKFKELELEEAVARIDTELVEYQTQIIRLKQSIEEIRLQKREAHAKWGSDTRKELRNRRIELFDLSQKILAAQDVLRRTEIVSPIDGEIVDLQVHTPDAVVKKGEVLLEVMPLHAELVVNASIDPRDIDEVRAGMQADIRLTSIARRWVVPIKGVVAAVSPDRIDGYFRARIEFDPESLALVDDKPAAGMGANVYIRGRARNVFGYLLSPITRAME